MYLLHAHILAIEGIITIGHHSKIRNDPTKLGWVFCPADLLCLVRFPLLAHFQP